jgi:hypothetical protein
MSPAPAPAPEARDFFVSFAKTDQDWAAWIAWQLEDAGYSVFLQDWDFRPGDNFILKMDESSAKANRTANNIGQILQAQGDLEGL